jgi:U3 small nucleolar RNA-associated protein 11
MSSLRNAVKRITHKERAQPKHREKKFGLLEKKKDYKYRAIGYHRKEDRLKQAKRAASMRNPDEFYFGMHNHQVDVEGKHRKTQAAKQAEFEKEIGSDTIRIMKDQDLKYIRLQKQRDAKKIEKLQSNLHFIDPLSSSEKRKHTIFVDTPEEADTFDAARYFDTLPDLVGRAFNRPRLSDLKNQKLIKTNPNTDDDEDDEEEKERQHHSLPTVEELRMSMRQTRSLAQQASKARAAAYAEMEARSKRVEALQRAESHLVTEALVASKGRKRKIQPAEHGKPAVYKWRSKRLK